MYFEMNTCIKKMPRLAQSLHLEPRPRIISLNMVDMANMFD